MTDSAFGLGYNFEFQVKLKTNLEGCSMHRHCQHGDDTVDLDL